MNLGIYERRDFERIKKEKRREGRKGGTNTEEARIWGKKSKGKTRKSRKERTNLLKG